MTTKEYNKIISDQIIFCKDFLLKKGAEYDESKDALAADDRLLFFKKAANLQGITNKQALLGFLTKHLISISDMIMSNNKFEMSQWTEKITDAINYFLILKAILIEEANDNIEINYEYIEESGDK